MHKHYYYRKCASLTTCSFCSHFKVAKVNGLELKVVMLVNVCGTLLERIFGFISDHLLSMKLIWKNICESYDVVETISSIKRLSSALQNN